MISDALFTELIHIVGAPYVTMKQDVLAAHGTDATKLAYMPDVVAFPRTAEEISKIFLLANRENFPVIPRGAGSGKSGGAVPVNGGLVLAMDRFDRILDIDHDNLVARVEPGVITSGFQDEVERAGLFYPPDPASLHISTIGGNVAENAGGLRAVKYGVTRDYILGLTVVLPTGEIINTGVKTAKGVVGYDLTRLIVGSEGTLAVITSITVRLIPKPYTTRTMIAFFRDASSAVQTVSDIIRNKVVPTAIEFMDSLCLDCVREEMGIAIPADARAVLLIEVDGDDVLASREARKVGEVCRRSGAIEFQAASDDEASDRLWDIRRQASESVFKLKPHKVSEDIVVPRSRMAEFVSFLDQLGRKYRLPLPAFGHAGDGNLHVNIMFDKNVPEEAEAVDKIVRELFAKVIDMDGTISGEHGIGLSKAPYLEMEISRPTIELMARLKRAFDPKGILNPGKIFQNAI